MSRPEPRKWKPIHPHKYKGDHTIIWARSSWEVKFFNWCDNNPLVLEWSSEETVIPYKCGTDNRVHRYFPDALIKVRTKDGATQTYLVEVKPKGQTQPPKYPGKQTKRYLTEAMTFIKNKSKWEAAELYCNQRGWKFQVITEDDLGL